MYVAPHLGVFSCVFSDAKGFELQKQKTNKAKNNANYFVVIELEKWRLGKDSMLVFKDIQLR